MNIAATTIYRKLVKVSLKENYTERNNGKIYVQKNTWLRKEEFKIMNIQTYKY